MYDSPGYRQYLSEAWLICSCTESWLVHSSTESWLVHRSTEPWLVHRSTEPRLVYSCTVITTFFKLQGLLLPWKLLSAWWQPIPAPITNSGNHCQHIILFCLICLFCGADDVETRASHMLHACSLASFSYALTKAFLLLAWFYYINRERQQAPRV